MIAVSCSLVGCQLEATEPASQPGSLAASIQAAQARMHARFVAARHIQEAIARSDLDRARVEAHDLAKLDEPELLSEWRPYLDNIRDAAHQIELSADVVAAAKLSATLGRRCAQCHEAIAAKITFPKELRPSDDPKLAPQMSSHQWAAARMWEGLIGPSDDRWLAGARTLSTAQLTIVAQSVTPTSELDVDDVARVRLYATRAVATKAQDARAETFGTLLATCAHCHAVLRDR
jgi:hypothetical protein